MGGVFLFIWEVDCSLMTHTYYLVSFVLRKIEVLYLMSKFFISQKKKNN